MLAEWAEGMPVEPRAGWTSCSLVTHSSAGEVLAQLRSAGATDSQEDIVSAWIKSMRGSDPDAAIYWLARLLHQGEDPLFLTLLLMILP